MLLRKNCIFKILVENETTYNFSLETFAEFCQDRNIQKVKNVFQGLTSLDIQNKNNLQRKKLN